MFCALFSNYVSLMLVVWCRVSAKWISKAKVEIPRPNAKSCTKTYNSVMKTRNSKPKRHFYRPNSNDMFWIPKAEIIVLQNIVRYWHLIYTMLSRVYLSVSYAFLFGFVTHTLESLQYFRCYQSFSILHIWILNVILCPQIFFGAIWLHWMWSSFNATWNGTFLWGNKLYTLSESVHCHRQGMSWRIKQ